MGDFSGQINLEITDMIIVTCDLTHLLPAGA